MNFRFHALGILLLASVLGSCTPSEVKAPGETPNPTTAVQPSRGQADEPAQAFQTLPPPPTMVVDEATDSVKEESTEEATPGSIASEPIFQVAFVEEGDVLNARSGPGVDNEVVGTFLPNESGITITGRGQQESGSTWVPVSGSGTAGWVNSRFLKDVTREESFCEVEDVSDLLDALESAVEDESGELLAQIVHPERGIRVRLNWWNPEVLFRGSELEELFVSQSVHDWGVEDGSGDAIEGSFSEVVMPLLLEDLLEASEFACNEILQGGSAGTIQLPASYPENSFYSFHRPGTDEFGGLNWGTWVVGIEKWQGTYFINFLVHFGWEI